MLLNCLVANLGSGQFASLSRLGSDIKLEIDNRRLETAGVGMGMGLSMHLMTPSQQEREQQRHDDGGFRMAQRQSQHKPTSHDSFSHRH